MYTEYQKLRTMPEIQYVVTKVWILLTQFSSSEIVLLGDMGYKFYKEFCMYIYLHIYIDIYIDIHNIEI